MAKEKSRSDPESAKAVHLGRTLPQWLEMTRSKNQFERLYAFVALGEIGEPAIPALAGALDDEDNSVRYWAAKGLGNIGAPAKTAVAALVKKLNDPCPSVRTSAAYALHQLGRTAEAVAALIKELDGANASARLRAVDCLGKIGPAAGEALPAVKKLLDDQGYPGRKAQTVLVQIAGKK